MFKKNVKNIIQSKATKFSVGFQIDLGRIMKCVIMKFTQLYSYFIFYKT